MKREVIRLGVACALAATVLGPGSALAQDAGGAKRQAAMAAGDASTSMAPAAHGEELKAEEGDQATERDPHAGAANPHGGDPHAGGGRGGMFEPPEDGSIEDPSLPVGTVAVHVADADGRPMARTEVTLGILYNSVAKGESRKRVVAMTDDQGRARFEKLDTGTGVAYRAMVLRDGATFSVPPFQLGAKSGTRAVLHVYPVVGDIEQTLVVAQSILYAEVKDDRVQIQQAFKIYNFGKTAWVPNDLVVPLPPKFTAFTSQQGMTDVGIDAVPGKGAKLRGTFAPGQHIVEFRWQLPYSGEAEVRFDVGMTPHMAAARVMAPASRDMILEVPGFPAPQPTTDQMGQRVLITEMQLKREDKALRSISVAIRGLPTTGPGRWIATLLAAGGLAFGIVLGAKKPATSDRRKERERLLADLEALERAHAAGDVGPKTYERARRELLDDIARTLEGESKGGKTGGRKKRAA